MALFPRLAAASALAAAMCTPAALAQEAEGSDSPRWTLKSAVGAPDWLDLSGSVRPRLESLANPFEAGTTEDQLALTVVTNLQAEAKAGSLVFGGELHDARVIAQKGDAIAEEVDALELGQLYLAWRPQDFILAGDELDVMAGWLTVDVGSRRLIARANYRNIYNMFQGVDARWTTQGGFEARAIHVSPRKRLADDTDSALDNEVVANPAMDEVKLSIFSLTAPVGDDATLEGYLYTLDEDDSADAATRNRDLQTVGVRLFRDTETGRLDFDLEYARQTGSIRATTAASDLVTLNHQAEMAHLELGYTFDGPHEVRISALYDYASGDRSPLDASSQRFDNLFGDRSFEFGPTSIFGALSRNNLASAGMRIEAKIDDASDILLMAREARLDQARDSFGGSGVRDPSGLSGRNAGVLVEARYRRWLIEDTVQLQTGLGWLPRGDFLKTAPNTTGLGDPFYTYVQATWEF